MRDLTRSAVYGTKAGGDAPLEAGAESQGPEATGTGRRLGRPGTIRNVVTALIVGAVIIGLVRFFDSPGGIGSQAVNVAFSDAPAPKAGKLAPDFTFKSPDGQTHQLSEYKGQAVWINFWASWCPPCRAENPDIEAVYQKYKDQGLVVLGMNLGEDTSTVTGYATRTGLSYPMGMDQTTEIAGLYRIVGIPTHYFIDRDGVLKEFRIGGLSKKTMESKVQSILGPANGQAVAGN
jgi:thiol-disulfide isomerase/thioredoxin